MPEETVGAADMAGCTCEPCKRKRHEPHSVRPCSIHSYTSRPAGGWRARRTGAEMADTRPAATFGIELETSVAECAVRDLSGEPARGYVPWYVEGPEAEAAVAARAAWDAWHARNVAHIARQRARFAEAGNISAEEAVSLAAPRGLWHAKHDGSVSGPEFASQPATLAYWHAQRSALAGMFKALLHGGVRSHDGDTCGLHVNIGADAFSGADHLARFANLVWANPRWTTRMSQRTHESMSHWARFDVRGQNTPEARRTWAQNYMRDGSAYQDRYSVLNGQNEGRVEFRLPRGTLRIDRFYAKLEWTAAMVEFTRDASNATNPSAFMRWVAQRPSEYPDLLAFMRERFSPERFGSAISGETVTGGVA